MTTLWKVACKEDDYPGMWQRWYKHQCVAVGWPPYYGYSLDGSSKEGGPGWSTARNAIKEMKRGDYVVVTLKGNRIGRLGQITGKSIEDDEWNPFVPKSADLPEGEVGRRIQVRWDLTVGPDNQDLVVQLPKGSCFSSGELRRSVTRIQSMSINSIREEMNDETNWVSLLGFIYEKALSDYIANYPNRLEDGLLPHTDKKIRERVFEDNTRLDVLLVDKQNRPVIVECKQHAPTVQDIKQLRGYMALLKKETEVMPRGILVHGGALKLSEPAMAEAMRQPIVEIVSYTLEVHFRPFFNRESVRDFA